MKERRLCQENACPLIYVDEGYVFEEVASSIQKAIKSVLSVKKKGESQC